MGTLQRMLAMSKGLMERLTVTQRLFIGSLMVLVVMTLFIVQQYSAKPAMVALMPGAADTEQGATATFLRTRNYQFEMVDGELMVPASEYQLIMAAMAESGSLPSNTSLMFEQLIERQGWTQTQRDKDTAENIALQNELSAVITRMRGINSAEVLIDVPRNVTLGQPRRAPTASVVVFSSGGINRATADTIASLVASSRAGLSPERVTVTDGTMNKRYRAMSPEDMNISDNLELALKIEQTTEQKIYDALNMPTVLVAVRAQVDATKKLEETRAVMPIDAGSISAPVETMTREFVNSATSQAGESGARPNTGVSVETGNQTGTQSSETLEEQKNEVIPGMQNTSTRDPRGFAKKINAVVNVPSTYVEALWRMQNPPGAADEEAATDDAAVPSGPTSQELETVFADLRTRILQVVEPLIATDVNDGGTQGAVTVSMIPVIPDLVPAQEGAGASFFGVPMGGQSLAGLVKTGLLAVMALMSMGLVVMTAMKSTKRQDLPSAAELVGIPPTLQSEADLVGEAADVDAALEGRELSEDEIKRAQMFEQVKQVITERPEDAAALVSRWIRAED